MRPRGPRRRRWAAPRPAWVLFVLAAVAVAVGRAAAFVSPCTEYNNLHASGDENCLDRTRIHFDKSLVNDKKDYEMVQGRDGEWVPLREPTPPTIMFKRNRDRLVRCVWCPETQECGHPLDFRVQCEGGWISAVQCKDTRQDTLDRVQDKQREDMERVHNMTPEQKQEFFDDEAKATKPESTQDRERAGLDDWDSYFECYGECVRTGTTSCDSGTTKLLTAKESDTGIASTAPAPCEHRVPANALTSLRARGVFSPSQDHWITSEAVACPVDMVTAKET